MIDSYRIRTKFGRLRVLALEKKGKYFYSLDGKMWQIDEDRSLYLVGSCKTWYKNRGWVDALRSQQNCRRFSRWEDNHRVYMGKLEKERALQ